MPATGHHPGDQLGTTIEDLEILAVGASRDGQALTAEDLDAVAAASKQVGFSPPLRLAAGQNVGLAADAAPAFGWLSDIHRQAQRLVATASSVPKKLADLIRRGAYSRIATDLYHGYKNSLGQWPLVLRGVTLHGDGLPRIDSLADLAGLYSQAHQYTDGAGEVRTYAGRVLTAGDVDYLTYDEYSEGAACAKEQKETEMDRFEQTDAVRPEDIDAAVVARVRAYQAQDPSLTFEDGYRQLAQRDPDVWRLYGGKTYATLGTVAVSPAEQRAAADWHEAGLEVLRLADAYQQEHPERSRTQAIHAVFRDKDNAALIRRYLRGSNPPGT